MSSPDFNKVKLVTRHSGKVTIKELQNNEIDGESLIAYEFIRKLFAEFARCSLLLDSKKYNFRMFPHYFRERQICSILTPIIHKMCNGIMMGELPVHRHHSDSDSHGWVDYWCIYKDYTFVIEVKESKDILDTETVRKNSVVGRWNKMKEQLTDIKGEIRSFDEKTEGVIRVGLHFVSSYSSKEYEHESAAALIYRTSVKETLTRFCKKLKPDYAGCWLVPEGSILSWDDFAFPGVMLFGKIFPVIKHR